MKYIKALSVAVSLFFVLVTVYAAYLGAFSSVKISEQKFEETEIFFDIHVGPYDKIARSWEIFKSHWEGYGIKECDAFAIYLDSPETPPEKLRSIIACKATGMNKQLKEEVATTYKFFTLPSSNAFYGVFPLKHEISYMLAPIKVYPEMQKKFELEKITPTVAIEYYGVHEKGDSIKVYMPKDRSRSDYQELYDSFSKYVF